MKHFYSISLLILFLLVGASCEDDYREIIFFSGDEPIYEAGTCTNILSSVSLYTIGGESESVKIDGGDGEYTVSNTDERVVTAVLLSETNGYRRLQLTRKALGEAMITVKDGSGKSAVLKVMVSEFKYTWPVSKVGIAIRGTVTDAMKAEIEAAFKGTYPVPVGGHYDLYPDSWNSPLQQGRLKVYLNDATITPLEGRYETTSGSFEDVATTVFHFAYDGKEYSYSRFASKFRSTGPVRMDLMEDVTAICKKTVSLPEGVTVYRVQQISL